MIYYHFSVPIYYNSGDMKRAFEQIKKYWLANLITFVICLLIGGGIFCLFFFLRNQTIVDAVDGAAVATVSILFLGLLFLMAHLGAFDTFAFGFKQLGSMLFAKDARRNELSISFLKKRNNSSYLFVSVIFAGLILAVALLVLEIIYSASF